MNIDSKRITRPKHKLISALAGTGIVIILLFASHFTPQPVNEPAAVHEKLGSLTLPFIVNQGQVDPSVAFYAPTFAGTLFVTHQGELVYSLPGKRGDGRKSTRKAGQSVPGWTLVETLIDAQIQPVAEQPATAQVSYFLGDDPKRWQSALPTYATISLGEVWPGIELSLKAHGNNVEKIFVVNPGADINDIRLRLDGVSALTTSNNGAIKAATDYGEIRFSAPVAWQEVAAQRMPVRVAYALNDQEYGFTLGEHDPALPVMIDPLLQSTYLGGTDSDTARDLAIHATSGDIYVVGDTQSIDFPGTTGGAQESVSVGWYTFVARISADLTALHQATYLGGSGGDLGYGIALHPTSNQVYVSGGTTSIDFPATSGGAQPASGGSDDAFVARLNANLTTLYQATYLGGDGTEKPWGLGIHPASGEIYVVGETLSDRFPGTAGGAQPIKDGGRDAFIAYLSADLQNLQQSTYLGANGRDIGYDITFHRTSGEVYVTGFTGSGTSVDAFPGTTGGAQDTPGGDYDAFVSRLRSDLQELYQSTYLEGSRGDIAHSVAIDPSSGNVYVTGQTRSHDFPATSGGAQEAHGGGLAGFEDVFVASLNSDLTTLNQSTYLGGNNNDVSVGIAVHPSSGEIYVAGTTLTQDFPGTTGGTQPTSAGLYDAFVARFSADLQTLNQSTYVGGSANDFTHGFFLHPSGDAYVAGETASSGDFPAVSGGAQPVYGGGGGDAFVSRLDASLTSGALTNSCNGQNETISAPLTYDYDYYCSVPGKITSGGTMGNGVSVTSGYQVIYSASSIELIPKFSVEKGGMLRLGNDISP